jgi:hypothetical protein
MFRNMAIGKKPLLLDLNNNSAYSAMPIKRLAGVGTRQLCVNFAYSTPP